MKTILVVSPNPTDGTSYYRCAGPLSSLRFMGEDVKINFTTTLDWTHLNFSDMIFLQRPFAGEHVQMVEMAKTYGIPIWIDYDDNLLEVGEDNPTFSLFGQNQCKMNIRYMLGLADVVTVTTNYLANRWAPYSQNIRVIPNAWDDYRFPLKDLEYKTPDKRIFWRGSLTHQKDLIEVAQGIADVANDFPDYSWSFAGYNAWMVKEKFKDKSMFKYTQMLPQISYIRALRGLTASVQIVPLHDDPFNRSKSNIAWIEGTYAGCAVVAPDMEEWKECLRYETSPSANDFRAVLESALKMDETQRKQMWQSSLNQIPRLSEVNYMRVNILKEYANSSYQPKKSSYDLA